MPGTPLMDGQHLAEDSLSVVLASNAPAIVVTATVDEVALEAGEEIIGKVRITPDLKIGAKSLALTMSTGTGSVPIPDTATIVGVSPVSSTAIRVGLEATEANGTATGAAAASALKKGIPVLAAVYTWFNIGLGTSRTLYVSGGASDVVEVVVM